MLRWKNLYKRVEFRVSIIYAIVSVLYILFSDLLVLAIFKNSIFLIKVQMLKGWFFVISTSLLIFSLLRKEVNQYEKLDMEKAALIVQLKKESVKKDLAYSAIEKVKYELENALIEASEAKRIKEEFISLMSHEIRTPLTGIIGFSEIAFREMDKNQETPNLANIHRDIGYIHKSAIRLNEIMENLITLSETSTGDEIRVEYKEFDIHVLINSILLLLQDKINRNLDEVHSEIRCGVHVYSDPVRLQIILLNLIGNAVKFTQNGTIKIIVEKTQNFYQFAISDTGIGIEKGRQEEIFDEFKQLEDSVDKRKYQGAGLGLAVCKKLLAALNGNIWLNSSIGNGSTFYFNGSTFYFKVAIPE